MNNWELNSVQHPMLGADTFVYSQTFLVVSHPWEILPIAPSKGIISVFGNNDVNPEELE